MSMFDAVINESSQNFGLGDKAGSLLSSLLSLITDQSRGGFAGFLDRFRQVGLGAAADSWVGTGANVPLSNEQVEAALGAETTDEMARQAGVDAETTKSALGTMIPSVVDSLTPDGTVPTENDLLSRIGGFLSGVGGSTVGTTGVMASDSIDRFGTAAAEEINRGEVSATAPLETVDEPDDDSPFKWLVPLALLILLIGLGWAFCRKAEAPTLAPPAAAVVNTNANARMAANTNAANTNAANR
jgi:uncharacterized protein YidB (DUF937 family)